MRSRFDERVTHIEEKERPPKSSSQIGVRKGQGIENIKRVYEEATEAERDYWGRWYPMAHNDVLAFAKRYNLDPLIAAGVVAVLSPSCKWERNLKAAYELMEAIKDRRKPKNLAFPESIRKAMRILQENSVDCLCEYKDKRGRLYTDFCLRGPKVEIFYASLVDPIATMQHIVLDGHAMSIWIGEKMNLEDVPTPSDETYNRMLADYHKAAVDLKVTPQALQATTWYVWKYTEKELEEGLESSPSTSGEVKRSRDIKL